MRFLKIAVAVAMALACGSAYAFHDGGVAACEGCHVMHNASSGQATNNKGPAANTTYSYLLQGKDQSSTCLICHSSTALTIGEQYIIASNGSASSGPANFTPAGDFGWLNIGISKKERRAP
jgi:hypothetical protein